jgi:hypothetical protein
MLLACSDAADGDNPPVISRGTRDAAGGAPNSSVPVAPGDIPNSGNTPPPMDSGSPPNASDAGGPGTQDASTADAGSTQMGTPDAGTPAPLRDVPCDKPFTAGSSKGCETTLEGMRVKFFPLAKGDRPTHLAIYFHGDTANDFDANYFDGIVEWARPKKILVFAARSIAETSSPGEAPWVVWWGADAAQTAGMGRIVQRFADGYGAPSENILYWGASGGSIYLTAKWLPAMGGKYPGVMVNNCGGSEPRIKAAWDYASATLRDKVAIYFNYGSSDFLAEDVDAAFTFFTTENFKAERLIHPGLDHCNLGIDIEGFTKKYFEKHL